MKDVPAQVCDSCGEGYTEGNVTDQVLTMAERAVAEGVQFDVRRFAPEQSDVATPSD